MEMNASVGNVYLEYLVRVVNNETYWLRLSVCNGHVSPNI
jgi:hypothetical protein